MKLTIAVFLAGLPALQAAFSQKAQKVVADSTGDAESKKLKDQSRREAYEQFEKYHKKITSPAHVGGDVEHPDFPMFRRVDKTGVLFATSIGSMYGFKSFDDPAWANMGQVRMIYIIDSQ